MSDRWILVAIGSDTVASSATSSVLLAVSNTGDPTGAWFFRRDDADSTDTVWADYPSIAFNNKWIIVTTNDFLIGGTGGFNRGRMYVHDKAALYSQTADTPTIFDAPFSTFSWEAFTIAPAVTHDSALATMYLVSDSRTTSTTALNLFTITGAVGSEAAQKVWTYTAPSSWDSFASTANIAPQLNSADKINNGDARVLKCVYRNGSLWCAQTIFLPVGGAATRSVVQWVQLSVKAQVVEQLGRVNDGTGSQFFAYPSLDVNKHNDVLVGYSRFASSQFASANYAFRSGSDAAGTLQDDTVLKAGLAASVQFDTVGRNRWGDYSGTVVDPTNDTALWTIQEYAETPFASDGVSRWGLWWGQISPTAPTPPANDSFSSPAVIGTASGNLSVSNTGATSQAGEPNHAGQTGGASIWYRWTAGASGSATFNTTGSNADTTLAVYTGSTLPGLVPVSSNDDVSGTNLDSQVTFTATSGVTYSIAVDGYRGGRGALTFGGASPVWPLLPTTASPTARR